MKVRSFVILLTAFLMFKNAGAQNNFTQYVNPFIGTGGHGHTFPGAVLPFGMVQLSPDTRADDSWDGCSGYHYSDSLIYGFSHTHLSGTGCSDWADILLMPVGGQASMINKNYASSFSHKNEKATAGFYEVVLDKYQVKAELTTTLRTGIHRYSFPAGSRQGLIIDLLHRDKTLSCNLKFIDSVTVSGYRVSEAWAKNQHVYFAMRFSKPFKNISYASGKQLSSAPDAKKRTEGAWFEFDPKDERPLVVKVAISPVSEQGALKNMEAEATHWDFEKYKMEAERTWNKQLNKIDIGQTGKDQLSIFYTALYHCCIHPSLNMDVDSQYRGRDNKIHKTEGFTNYSVFSLWDTYRALNPLMTIIEPARSVDFINTFLAQYKASGRLPVWELSSNETDCMIGFHSVAVIADALVKGFKGIDIPLAYTAMKSASNYSAFGIPEFNRKGYLQVDDENESVSKTLEYGFDNWCIAQVAPLAGKKNEAAEFVNRSQAWKNIFDPSTCFMRPRKNGGWLSPFYASEINNHFTEGNSWQYSFYVPHDVSGLIRQHRGKEKFEQKLDELFTTTEKTQGRDQADVSGLMGQYAHGNEPSHHMAYLYNYVSEPQKTLERVHKICNEFYKSTPDGLIGNEDCGQMSAWYVFSCMGFYPVCPASGNYALGAPFFKNINVHLESGDTISIRSNNGADLVLSSVKINGRSVNETDVRHADIAKGGKLEFIFAATKDPLSNYGKKGLSLGLLRSASTKMIPAVIIQSESRIFKEKSQISLSAVSSPSVRLVYTLDGSEPRQSSLTYTAPFSITNNCTVKAKAYSLTDSSVTTEAHLYKLKYDYPVTILSAPDQQYAADGPQSLMDGLYGSTDWRKGDWLGVQGRDFECVVDMKEEKEISYLSLSCLQDTRAWIVFPPMVSFFVSDDGVNFKPAGAVTNTIKADDYRVQVKKMEKQLDKKVKTRYIKVTARTWGKLPEWHIGQGGEAHIFVDELEIR